MKRNVSILILFLTLFSGKAFAQCTIVRTITGPATVCEGSAGNVYTTEAGMTEYAWIVSAGGTITAGGSATENTVTVTWNTAGARTISINYRDTDNCTATLPTPYGITVNPLPGAAGSISGSATVCQGQSGVSYSVTAITNANSYTWSYTGTGATITGSTELITINFSASATGGNLTVYGSNGCGNGSTGTPLSITVNSVPSAPGSITGDATPCQGESGVGYSITPISGAASYIWAYSGTGATISGSSNSVTINFASNATGGDLTVYATNSCGDGTTGTPLTITPDLLPGAAGVISGTATVCQGWSSVSYNVAAITNATGYSWSYTGSGATITGTTESITISFSTSATGGNLTVRGTNLCGNGTTSAPYAITVNPLPAAAGTISGTASVCRGRSGVSYSVPAIANASGYTWSYSGTGATITGSTQSVSISFSESATSGNLTVFGTNSCGSGITSPGYAITVNLRPVPAVTGPDRACITSTGNIYTTAAGMTGYDWDVSSDGTVTAGGGPTNTSVTVTWDDNGPETVRLNYIDGNGCTATAQTTYNVTVIEKPLPTSVQFAGVLREFATLTASYNYSPDVCFPEVPAETEISWYRSSNASGTPSSLITTKPGTDKTLVLSSTEVGKYIKIKVRLNDGAELMDAVWSSTSLSTVAVNAKPVATDVSVTGTLLLNNILDGNYTYSDAEFDAEGGTTFQWYRDDDGSDAGSSVITGATSQSYAITTGDRNKYVKFRVTPKAQNGTTPGDAVSSAWVGPVSDNPPVASAVSITGSTRVGSVLTGNYQYTDVDGDAEGTSTLRWYSATSSTGTGSTQIATGKTFLLTNSLIDSYIGFSVTPVAQAGVSPGATVTTATYIGPVINDPPYATIQPITGSLDVNGLLTGHYVYSDTEGDIESGTLFQWYSHTASTGIFTLISGETGIAHLIKNSEQGRYFKIRVTPVAATGDVKTGDWVESPAFGPANSQPTAGTVQITGTPEVGSILTGSYDYDDVDLADSEGTSTFRWLRNGTVPISGETGLTYLVTGADEGYKLSFEVTPVSTPGYPFAGTPVQSAQTIAVVDPSPLTPVASQVCIEGIRVAGQVLRGKYYYNFYKSEGSSTYQWYRNGVAITGATGIQYTLLQVQDIDSNADITFEVTPKSSNTPPKVGTKVTSRPLARIILPKDQYSVSEDDVTLTSNVIDLGGVFSGTGVTGNIFSPEDAGSAGSPYTLSYLLIIAETSHNCSQQASKLVYVNPNVSSFVGFDPIYCHDSGPDVITVTGVPTGPFTTIMGFTISDNKGIVSQSGTTVTIDPGRMRPGVDRDVLYFSYYYLGTFYQIRQTFKIDSVGTEFKILNLDKAYCKNNPKEYISIEGVYPLGGTANWTGDILSDMKAGSAYADPSLGIPGLSYPVSYQYRSPMGCFSAVLEDTVKINPLPKPSFALNLTYNIDGGAISLVPVQAGGTFSGDGVSGDKLFPDIAGLGGHDIRYEITDGNQCSADTTRRTTIRRAQGNFTDIPPVICYSDTTYNVKITGLPTVGVVTVTGFTNKKNSLVYTMGETSADYNVPAAGEGADTLYFTYKWDDVDYQISKGLNIDSIGDVFIKNLTSADLICDNMALKELFPSITGGQFTGPVTGSFLNPDQVPGPSEVIYTFTNLKTGCSKTAVVPVIIYPAPAVAFAPEDVCVEGSFDTTFFINNTVPKNIVKEWLWEFTDAGAIYKDTSFRAGYRYRSGGLQKIALTATTFNGCSAKKESTFDFGIRPEADFTWKSDCMHPGDSLILKDKTISTSPILSRSWSLFNGTVFSVNELEARYPKTGPGYLKFQYIVKTSYLNCNDTVEKEIYIKPAITIDADGYSEDFEAGNGGWIKEDTTGNTWSFGLPDRNIIDTAYSGYNAWCTNFSNSGLNRESSSIASPCFDFTASERPLISLWLWKIFTRDIDGAVLQYRIGDGDEWKTVGAIDDGIEWYNSAVIRGKPGDSQMGWTTRGDPDDKWKNSIHTLDELKGKTDVVFRVAYGSDGSEMDNDGIAFDNIWIGERSRNILLEHFTNITDESGFNADALVDTIVSHRSEDVINIQYHTNFPDEDPYYNANPGEAGARILFYGLTRAPYSFVDGGTDDENNASYYSYSNSQTKIDSTDVIKRSLIPSDFKIELTTDIYNKVLTVSTKVTALKNISAANLTLFLAVTEKKNTLPPAQGGKEYWNIFRKFIPDAGGLILKNNWLKGESVSTAGQSWTIDKILNNSDIKVIAFIQDAINKDVYQAASVTWHDVVVGMKDLPAGGAINFAMFPNPVINRLTILFGEPVEGETEIRIIDVQGIPVLTYKAESGIDRYIIDDLNLKQGLYMVRISRKGIDLGSRKLVVAGR